MRASILIFALAISTGRAHPAQLPLTASPAGSIDHISDSSHPGCPPRIEYVADDEGDALPSDGMRLHSMHVSGEWKGRVDLTFFSDGYTADEESKFIKDASKLTADIVSPGGAMSAVSHLLNIYAVFLPSPHSGIGTHDTPLPNATFGLYRPGPELRAVYVQHPKHARAACRFWRKSGKKGGEGGCDQPILLGNDPLYGGLGGEFTIITASELNGPLVLRHELGHSLIGVGEEYEGGYVYSGVNSDKVKHLSNLKWRQQLSAPESLKIEDVKVPLQAYPWHDLSSGPYSIAFNSSSNGNLTYPTALLRMSLSSIPYPHQIAVHLNGQALDLAPSFPGGGWEGSKDRRWVEVNLPKGLSPGPGEVVVELTQAGEDEPAGQGGKLITSVELIEYGPSRRCNLTGGFIGAFPTYDIDGGVTLRPTNEACLMRKVNYPSFCPVCAKGLETALHKRISKKQKQS